MQEMEEMCPMCRQPTGKLVDFHKIEEEAHKRLKAQGLTVIGTCGGCKYWIGDPVRDRYPLGDLRRNRQGLCEKRPGENWTLDDGCKYWEEEKKP